MTQGIASLGDFDFVICLAAGNTPDAVWIPFGQEKHRFPFAAGCTAVMAPDMFPFLQSKQMDGMIGGLASPDWSGPERRCGRCGRTAPSIYRATGRAHSCVDCRAPEFDSARRRPIAVRPTAPSS